MDLYDRKRFEFQFQTTHAPVASLDSRTGEKRMSTARQHLSEEVHKADAGMWKDVHDHFKKVAGIHREMHKADGFGENEDGHHKQLADEHDKLAEKAAAHAEHHLTAAEKCGKAAGDDLGKSAPNDLDGAIERAFLKFFGDRVRPSNVSLLAPPPSLRAIPRAGQKVVPAGAQAPSVPMEFEKVFSTEDGDLLR